MLLESVNVVKPVRLNHPRPHVKIGGAGLNTVTLRVTGNLSVLLGDGCIRVETFTGLGRVSFEMFRLRENKCDLLSISRGFQGPHRQSR